MARARARRSGCASACCPSSARTPGASARAAAPAATSRSRSTSWPSETLEEFLAERRAAGRVLLRGPRAGGAPATRPTCWSSTRSTAPGRRWRGSSPRAWRWRSRRSATASRRWPTSRSAAWSRSSRATGSWRVRGEGVRSSRPVALSAETDVGRMFWAYGFRGRPVRPTVEVLGDLIDASSVGGGTFELGSQAFAMTRIVTGPARRGDRGRLAADRRRPGDARGVRASRAGRGPQQLPYDLAAPWLCLREAGGVVSDGWGEPLDDHRLLGSGHEYQMSSISACQPRRCTQRWCAAIDAGVARLRATAGVTTPRAYRPAAPSRRAGGPPIDAPARLRSPQEPRRLREHRRAPADRRDPRARRAAEGQARAARLGHRVRRRRRRDPEHARPADDRRRARVRVAGDLRARGVLQHDQADAQRAPGQPAGR